MSEELRSRLSDQDVEEGKAWLTQEKLLGYFFENRQVLALVLIGLILVGVGLFFIRSGLFEGTKVEVLEANGSTSQGGELVVEIGGAVQKGGVYKLNIGSRVDDLLIVSGGLSASADRDWVGKNLNRAAKLADGQKIYIPRKDEVWSNVGDTNKASNVRGGKISGVSSGVININTASLSELDRLPGIGAVRAQAIIDGRPYSSAEELLAKKVIPQNVYERIKEKIVAP